MIRINKVFKAGIKFHKDNPKIMKAVYGTAPSFLKTGYENVKNISENKKQSGKIHVRKVRYYQIKKAVLNKVEKRSDLLKYKFEVQNYIDQLENEISKQNFIINNRRIKKWNEIYVFISDEMRSRDYLEFVMLNQDPNYNSSYFIGFEELRSDFLRVRNIDSGEFIRFLKRYSDKDLSIILRDFDIG